MVNQVVKAFVLRRVPYGENRLILDLLIESGELRTCSAYVGKRCSFLAATQLFVYGEYDLKPEQKERYKLTEASVLYGFQDLLLDPERFGCVAHLSELLVDGLKDQEALPQLFSLCAYSLARLEKGEDPLLDIRISQMRFLCEMGFRPNLPSNPQSPQLFSFQKGSSLSGQPFELEERRDTLLLMPDTCRTLSHVALAPWDRLFSFRLSPDIRTQWIQFSDRWCQQVMEKTYPQLDWIRELEKFKKEQERILSKRYEV